MGLCFEPCRDTCGAIQVPVSCHEWPQAGSPYWDSSPRLSRSQALGVVPLSPLPDLAEAL